MTYESQSLRGARGVWFMWRSKKTPRYEDVLFHLDGAVRGTRKTR